jgi:hypothetical protein
VQMLGVGFINESASVKYLQSIFIAKSAINTTIVLHCHIYNY